MCIRQRIGGSNPPLTAIFKMKARTKVRAFFFYILQQGGMRIPDRGSTTGAASWTDCERCEQAARRASEASQSPPLTAIFKMRARTKVRAFFFYILVRGDENPRPGFDNWRSQLDRLRAKRTDCPQGERSESIPPLTAIFKEEPVRKYGLFSFIFSIREFAPCALYAGWRYAYPTYEKLIFNHLCILVSEKIHQRPDRRQQAAPGRIHRVDHFPSWLPRIQHPNKLT